MESVVENKDMLDFDTLSGKMVKIANELVGNVGASTNNSLSIYNQEYCMFSVIIKENNEYAILDIWKNWIKAYLKFTENDFVLRFSDLTKSPTIYWRQFPQIEKYLNNKKVIIARLLISRSKIKLSPISQSSRLCRLCLRPLDEKDVFS